MVCCRKIVELCQATIKAAYYFHYLHHPYSSRTRTRYTHSVQWRGGRREGVGRGQTYILPKIEPIRLLLHITVTINNVSGMEIMSSCC